MNKSIKKTCVNIPTNFQTITGFYGHRPIPCNIFVDLDDGWYCVEGSCNVNQCDSVKELINGVNVEYLNDIDCFTIDEVTSLEYFESAVYL